MKDYYAGIAKSYDALHGSEQLKKAGLINSRVKLQGVLLDIGAGTCVSTCVFLETAKMVVALEPSLEMLLQNSNQKILRVCGKAEELPFPNSCFDSIVSLTALHHADLEKAFSEIMRVAKPDAVIVVSFFKRAKSLCLAKKLFRDFECVDEGTDLVFIKQGNLTE